MSAPRLAIVAAALGVSVATAAHAQPGVAPPPAPPPEEPRLPPVQVEAGLELVGSGDAFVLAGRVAGAVVFALGDAEGWQPFVGVGAVGSFGTAWVEDPRAVGGTAETAVRAIGPELRLGTARDRDLGSTRFVAKGALVFARARGALDGLVETGGARGVRLGLAVASPGVFLRLADDAPSYDRHEDEVTALLAILIPTEVELTAFVYDDELRVGGVLGYSF